MASQLDLVWLIRSTFKLASLWRKTSFSRFFFFFLFYFIFFSLSRIYYKSLLLFSSGYYLNLQNPVYFRGFSFEFCLSFWNFDLGFQWSRCWVSHFGVCAWIGAQNATGLVVRARPRWFRHRVCSGWSYWSIWSG